MKKYTFSIHTLGCKVNSYESNVIIEKCLEHGFEKVDFGQKADIIIINTCAVTEESTKKSRQFIRRARRNFPSAIIAVTGCYSQICDDESLLIADIVIGSKNKSYVADYIEKYIKSGEKIFIKEDLSKKTEFELMKSDFNEHTRATVKIQDGCNNFCSYCIIPYARGRICSKDINDAYNEVSGLVKSGYKEIVITGIHLASYGLDGKDYDLCDFLEKADGIKGIKRIRLGSLEPKFITEKNVLRLKKLKHLCPQFHLSLQSGSDETLKRMNRKYTTEEFYRSTMLLYKNFENCAITTDVIVGFCGETDEEFNNTCEFVKKIGFSKIHLFPYSPRKGTVSYKMEDTPAEIKNSRMKIIEAIEKDLSKKYKSNMIGKTFEVLCEKTENGITTGYTENYIKVRIKGEIASNTIRKVLITDISDDYCIGETI